MPFLPNPADAFSQNMGMLTDWQLGQMGDGTHRNAAAGGQMEPQVPRGAALGQVPMEDLLKQLLMQRAHSTLNEAAVEHQAVTQQLQARQQLRMRQPGLGMDARRSEPINIQVRPPGPPAPLDPGIHAAQRLMKANRGMAPEAALRAGREAVAGTEPSGEWRRHARKDTSYLADTPEYNPSTSDFASSASSMDNVREFGEAAADAAKYAGRRMFAPIQLPKPPTVIPATEMGAPISEASSPAAYLIDPEPATPEARDALNTVLAERLAGGSTDYWQLQGLSPWSAPGVMAKLPDAMLNQEEDAIDMGGPKLGKPHEPANRIGGTGDDNRDKLTFPRGKPQVPSLRIQGGNTPVAPDHGTGAYTTREANTGEPDAEMLKRLYALYGVHI